jgi:pilus retraction protein PilT
MSSGNMERVLRLMSEKGASDVYLSANSPILIKINGQLLQLSDQPLTHAQPRQLLAELLTPSQLEELEDTGELNIGVGLAGVGSFRLSGFKQRGSIAAVFRCIPFDIPSLESLNVPSILNTLVMEKRGLILMVGATGTGKSTTLASMLEQRNQTMAGHILTIEDPIEFIFNNKKSVVNQREVGTDTQSWATALRSAMRQDPDVVLIGEMRDLETVKAALAAAETGHFVMSTLHTTDAKETINRIIDFFPPHEQKQVRLSLAASLKGIVCQRLVVKADGAGRAVAMEIAVMTPRLAAAISEPDKTELIDTIVENGAFSGMQTFDQHLLKMVLDGTVSISAAKLTSTNTHDFTVMLKRAGIDPVLVDLDETG